MRRERARLEPTPPRRPPWPAAPSAAPLAFDARDGLLRHDAHLLRERGAAPGPRVHDDRGRHPRPPPPPARRGRVLPHRHRRARRAGRARGRAARGSRRRSSPTATRSASSTCCRASTRPTTSSSAPPTRATSAASRRSCSACTTTATSYKGTYEGWYCPKCADFKTEAEIGEGNTCPIHGTPLDREHEENWFFRLSTFEEPLKQLYAEQPDFVTPRIALQRGARVHQRRPPGRLALAREADLGRRGPVGPGPRLLRLVRRAAQLLHGARRSPATART